MTCKGICTRHKAMKPLGHGPRYGSGQKRCELCEIFIRWDGNWCPCCGFRLRTKPRNSKFRARGEKKNTVELNDDGTVTYLSNIDGDDDLIEYKVVAK